MNTMIIVVVAFSLGIAFGSTFLGTCNTKAYEWQDNPSTRFNLQQLQREQEWLKQQQDYLRQKQERPCP